MEKQAILIIAHNNIWNLKKILESLDSKYFDFFIHIDLKSNIKIEEIKKICKISKINIFKEKDIRWADYSQVECEMYLIKEVINSNDNYEYLHLISGVDMPIKSAKEIYEFFDNNKGKEFLHFQNENLNSVKQEWIKYYHLFMKNYRFNKLSRRLNKIFIIFQKLLRINRIKKTNYKFVTGANWFSITNKFAEYVISKEKEIEKIFKYTRSADEIFMQTILYNSKYKENLYYKNFDDNYIGCMRLIDWNRGNPYIWKTEDFKTIIKSEFMFARKFDMNKDKKIIELISNNNLNNNKTNKN